MSTFSCDFHKPSSSPKLIWMPNFYANCIKEISLGPFETIPGLPGTISMVVWICWSLSEPSIYKGIKCNHLVYNIMFCVKSEVFGKSTSASGFHSDNSHIFIICFYHLKCLDFRSVLYASTFWSFISWVVDNVTLFCQSTYCIIGEWITKKLKISFSFLFL